MKSPRESLGSHTRVSTSVRSGRRARSAPRARGEASFTSEDLGRIVHSYSGLLTFAGLTLGVFVSRNFFVLPVAVAFTLAQEMAKEHLGADARPRRR